MQRLRRVLVCGAVAVLAVPLGIGSAMADDDHDDHDDHDDGDLDVELVVDGLDSPRGLAFDRRDNLWVAQAGRGGDGPCYSGPEGATCLGSSGAISKLEERRDGHYFVDVVPGLPSLGLEITGNNAIGPSDVAFDRKGRLLATIGLGADPDIRTDPEAEGGVGPSELASLLATVQRVNVRNGAVSQVADIGAFELAENPEPEDEDSNPHSIAVGRHRTLVADAGGNSLLEVHRNGDVETVFVFPKEAAVQIPGAPAGAMIQADPVPNSVVEGPDGAFYVGQLTGFPFTPGTATVWRFERGKAPTVYADGFTNIIDLAFDDDGNLLVLEIAHHGLLAAFGTGDWSGALIEVDEDDPAKHTILLEDPLVAPGGIAVEDDDAYISNMSVFPGQGQILKVELDD